MKTVSGDCLLFPPRANATFEDLILKLSPES